MLVCVQNEKVITISTDLIMLHSDRTLIVIYFVIQWSNCDCANVINSVHVCLLSCTCMNTVHVSTTLC